MDANNNSIVSWVFLSHSNEDYERVTFVRNTLEKYHKRPIMFFLKCMTNKKELDPLLKREIDAREEFILCDSENARKSDFVREEVEYIKSQERKYQTIDLNASDDEIEEALREYVDRDKVFISCSHNDNELAMHIGDLIKNAGYTLMSLNAGMSLGDTFCSGEIYGDCMRNILKKTVDRGYFLLLLSKSSIQSHWVFNETEEMIHQGGQKWIIPVICEQLYCDSHPSYPSWLKSITATRSLINVSDITSVEEKASMIVKHFVKYDRSLSR